MVLKAIIFDFDGVIVESMDIKTQAFKHLFRNYPEEIIKKVVELHLDNGGMSRFKKFEIIYRDYLEKKLTKDEQERLNKEFSEFCYEKIIICPFVDGIIDFLNNNYQKYLFFVVTGTPHDEINKIIDERRLRKYFKGVWGIPGTKAEHSNMILKTFSLKPTEVVFIGDSPTDYTGAEEAGIQFIARVKHGEYNPFDNDDFNIKYTIPNFISFEEVLDKVN